MLLSNNSNKILIFILLYVSLLIGFYLNENSSGGAYPDFLMRKDLIENFRINFSNAFLNYNDYGDRHSPVIIMILTLLYFLFNDLDMVRLLHLNLLPLLIFISYRCLILKFPNNDKNIIFLICCVFFLSPSLRSIAIWPDSRISGLVLFLYSIYFFLKYKKNHNFKDCIFNNVFLIFSAYLSPNFSLFFLYFFFYYFKQFGFSKELIIIILINLMASLPMLYYLFILDVNFLSTVAIGDINILNRLNPFNKILIISSLIFFYMMPFVASLFHINKGLNDIKIKYVFQSTIILFTFAYFFNYLINYTGGGIFFRLSYFLFDNSYLFLVITFLSILFILNVFKLNFNNFLLFFILVVSNPQLTIYHKYYDPLLILMFFLFFQFNFSKKNFLNKKFLSNIYIFYSVLLVLNFGRSFFNY